MSVTDPIAVSPSAGTGLASRLGSIDERLERWSDRLNPILVKETRQALKSRQFGLTFTLLLIGGWVWTVLGLAANMPNAYYGATGPQMLAGYLGILSIAMLVIIPYSAFRSIAGEREDGTHELVSITTLSGWDLVRGKLGSAVVQMLVYYSALTPFICFTYLLRGVDLPSIVVALTHTFFASLMLSALGLVLAGVSQHRTWRPIVNIAFMFFLVMGVWTWLAMLLTSGTPAGLFLVSRDVWDVQLFALTVYLSYTWILAAVARAQNGFVTENRSTQVRIAIAVQVALAAGWAAYAIASSEDEEPAMVAFIWAALQGYIFGAFFCCEPDLLSPRVRRGLPTSFLGRVFFTWFNPGSGTGYVFTVGNIAAMVGVTLVWTLCATSARLGNPNSDWMQALTAGGLCLAYVAAYLGIARIVLSRSSRQAWVRGNSLGTAILVMLLPLLAGAIPASFQALLFPVPTSLYGGYTYLQTSNVLWTVQRAIFGEDLPDGVVPTILLTGLIVFLWNLTLLRREVSFVRSTVPAEVTADDSRWKRWLKRK